MKFNFDPKLYFSYFLVLGLREGEKKHLDSGCKNILQVINFYNFMF